VTALTPGFSRSRPNGPRFADHGLMSQLVPDEQAGLGRLAVRRAAVLTAVLVVATLLITGLVWAEWGPLQRLDDAVVVAAVAWTDGHPDLQGPLNRIGVTSGKRNLWPLAAVVAAALVVAGRRYEGALVALAVASTTVVTGGMKRVLTRERPEWYVPEDPMPTSSFPSGHVALWVGFAVALAIVLPLVLHRTLSRTRAWLLTAPMVALLVVVSVQRVLQGRHYPSDVLVGVLVGAGCALASWVLIEVLLQLRSARQERPADVTTAWDRPTPAAR